MPSGIFGPLDTPPGAPIVEEVKYSLIDGQPVVTLVERYPGTGGRSLRLTREYDYPMADENQSIDTCNEKSYKARKRARKREKNRLQRV